MDATTTVCLLELKVNHEDSGLAHARKRVDDHALIDFDFIGSLTLRYILSRRFLK
jgi:hypothetical protein